MVLPRLRADVRGKTEAGRTEAGRTEEEDTEKERGVTSFFHTKSAKREAQKHAIGLA